MPLILKCGSLFGMRESLCLHCHAMIKFPEKSFESTSTPVAVLDPAGETVWMNKSFKCLFGYGLAELKADARWPLFSTVHDEKFRFMVSRAFRGETPEPLDLPAACSDGAVRNIRWITMAIYDNRTKAPGAIAVFGTETGGSEKTGIDVFEERYRIIFENSGIGMVFIGEDTTIAVVNREFELLTGYPKDRVEGKMSWTEFVADPHDLERMKDYHRLRRVDPDTAPGIYDTKLKTREGAVRDVIIRIKMVPETNYSLASILDITQRKIAEEALRESEEKYRSLVNNMQDTLYRCDTDGTITFAGLSGARLLGHDSPEELIGKNIATDYYYDPEDRPALLKILQKEGHVSNYEVRLRRVDGTPVSVMTNSHLHYDSYGKLLGVEGIFTDISRRKEAEELFRQSEEKFMNIFMTAPDCIAITRVSDGMILDVNLGFKEITGWERSNAINRTSLDISFWVNPDDRERMVADMGAGREIIQREFQFRRKDGMVRDGIYSARPVRISGEACLIFILNDVTERKEAEKKFKRLADLHHTILDTASVSISFLNDRKLQWVNNYMTQLFGYSEEELIGQHSSIIYPSEADYIRVGLAAYEGIRNGGVYKEEVRFRKKDGTLFWAILTGKGVNPERPQEGSIWISQDITDLKNAEEKLKQLADLHQTVLDTVSVGILYVKERRVQWTNNNFAKMFGYTNEEIIGKDTSVLYYNIDVYNKIGDEAYGRIATSESYSIEMEALKKDGARFWCNLIGKAINPADMSEGSIWMAQDITERKMAEEALRNSLQEKELLLKELYHRTKNNMQVICSLLSLQSGNVQDRGVHDFYTGIETKIQTMALVHQMLYESQDLSNINLRDFVDSLSRLILRSYNLTADKLAIRQFVDDVPLSIDTAMPLGLVLNELISNSIKHAFPGNRSGEIVITMSSAGNEIKIEYRDNGSGLPEGFDPAQSPTLGMDIIRNISERQLNGDIRFFSDNGFGCIIRIKTDLYRRRI